VVPNAGLAAPQAARARREVGARARSTGGTGSGEEKVDETLDPAVRRRPHTGLVASGQVEEIPAQRPGVGVRDDPDARGQGIREQVFLGAPP